MIESPRQIALAVSVKKLRARIFSDGFFRALSQHSLWPRKRNEVNHGIWLPGKPHATERKSLAEDSGLDQTLTNAIENQTRRLMNVELLHQPCSMRFDGFYTDTQ
jgi:hypothetical protein